MRARAWFLGKDPESNVGDSPTLFATDQPRTGAPSLPKDGRSPIRKCLRMSVRCRTAKRSAKSQKACWSSTSARTRRGCGPLVSPCGGDVK